MEFHKQDTRHHQTGSSALAVAPNCLIWFYLRVKEKPGNAIQSPHKRLFPRDQDAIPRPAALLFTSTSTTTPFTGTLETLPLQRATTLNISRIIRLDAEMPQRTTDFSQNKKIEFFEAYLKNQIPTYVFCCRYWHYSTCTFPKLKLWVFSPSWEVRALRGLCLKRWQGRN